MKVGEVVRQLKADGWEVVAIRASHR